jgi:hypothetical protein
MTIDEIYNCEDLSTRSINLCKENYLRDLTSILLYYRNNKSFLKLKNCGKNSNDELVLICLKYSDFNRSFIDSFFLNKYRMNFFIKEKFETLSTRTKNALRKYLNNDFDVCNVFIKIVNTNSFKIAKLNNIGKYSIQEIEKFKSDISYEVIHLNSDEMSNSLESNFFENKKTINYIISNLTRSQREIVNNFIEISTNNLSNRSKNAITTFLDNNLKIKNISDKILSNDEFNFQCIKNVGTKTVTELKSFIDSIIEFIDKVADSKNEKDIVTLRNRFFIEKTFSISEIPDEILESQSIFKLTDFLINQNVIFEKFQSIIFTKSFKIYQNQPELTVEEISKEFNRSNQNIRTLKKKCLDELYNKFQFIQNLDDDLFQNYGIDLSQNYIAFDEGIFNHINSINNTNFSTEFIRYLIFVYISDKFEIIGDLEDVLLPNFFKSRIRHNWDNIFLIKRNISNEFDFNAFVTDFDRRLNERIEETYAFNLKSYLTNFSTNRNSISLSIISPIAEYILNDEFGFLIDINENIVFKRNTVKQVPEYAIEALEKLGLPSKIEDIYKLIELNYPKVTKSQDALRGSLQRTPEIIYFGRNSTYGLKKWETEKEGIKGGTIRSIVIKFLELESKPIHISKITKHVLQYRPDSNEKSIYYNLKMDESNSFIFFKKSHVGLILKKYNNSYELMSNDDRNIKKSWEDRYSDLIIFLNQNGRLPFSSGCPENEIKLYRWYNIQLSKSKKGGLDSKKTLLINEIFDSYSKKASQSAINKYNKLVAIVNRNKGMK